MNKFSYYLLIGLSLGMLSGCSEYLGYPERMVYPPAEPIDNVPPPKKNGGIYQQGHEVSYYEDHIARHVGDVLTVLLEESTTGEKQAKTKTTKTASNDFPIPTFFGRPRDSLQIQSLTDQQFNGEGQTNEQNKLTGTITVTVTRVFSNGNMAIQGESWLTLNTGREYIRLTGIVRPEDIDSNNQISSHRIAAAQISYSGYGQVGDASRGGLVTQGLFKFWPY